jgi:sulfur carrier protein
MKIIVNGDVHDVLGTRIDTVLSELGFNARVVATAHNGEFVAIGARAATPLRDGDHLEVLAPMQGG